ncbi:hypothetical protein [Streptomyces sp. NBC_00690]|uniref:hypothetical protein n=1 Tax=Streptomyces sp. NBC_00690 TaxID=2975808 RepID=UPI002E2C2E1A|nr:hypothetical protein [Streptomyces sp. NBC_00690]
MIGGAAPSAATTGSERQAVGRPWLLAAAPSEPQAVREWQGSGAAWLRPGLVFTAVSVAASLVHAAVNVPGPEDVGAPLGLVLDGPVFYREQIFGREAGYTVLLLPSAGEIWRVAGSVVESPRALLLVPAPNRCEPDDHGPWWVLPPGGSGALCTPTLLASLIGVGRERIAREGDVL